MLLKYGLIEQLPTEGVKILVNNSYLLVLIIFYLIFSVKMTFTKKKPFKFQEASSRPWTSKPNIVREESNISNSTLRRKLFAAMIPDEDLADESESDIEENDAKSPTVG